jgi:hypothetical protein
VIFLGKPFELNAIGLVLYLSLAGAAAIAILTSPLNYVRATCRFDQVFKFKFFLKWAIRIESVPGLFVSLPDCPNTFSYRKRSASLFCTSDFVEEI